MARKTLTINGVDFTNFFPNGGYTVSYDRIEGGNEGRMLNGSWAEDIIAVEAVITLPLMPLTETQQALLLTTLYQTDYASVQYFDPKANTNRSIQARYETNESKHRGSGTDGNEYWTGMTITFTENVS